MNWGKLNIVDYFHLRLFFYIRVKIKFTIKNFDKEFLKPIIK